MVLILLRGAESDVELFLPGSGEGITRNASAVRLDDMSDDGWSRGRRAGCGWAWREPSLRGADGCPARGPGSPSAPAGDS